VRTLTWLALGCTAGLSISADVGAQSGSLIPIGELRLEETTEHFVVWPQLSPDPPGGWLYWDNQAHQVRLHGTDGSLRAGFGRRGSGPGEFERPVGVGRLANGDLVVVDRRGRVSIWNSDGSELRDDFNSGVAIPRGLVVEGSDKVVIQGAPIPSVTGDDVPVLHRLDLPGRKIEESFFVPPLDRAEFEAARRVESPAPWFQGDLLYVIVPSLAFLWAVPAEAPGSANRIPIQSDALASSASPEVLSRDVSQFRSWTQTATFAGRFMPMPTGGWIVQTWALRPDGPTYGLVRVDENGRRRWEMRNTAILLAADPASGHMLLWDPISLDPGIVQFVAEEAPGS